MGTLKDGLEDGYMPSVAAAERVFRIGECVRFVCPSHVFYRGRSSEKLQDNVFEVVSIEHGPVREACMPIYTLRSVYPNTFGECYEYRAFWFELQPALSHTITRNCSREAG